MLIKLVAAALLLSVAVPVFGQDYSRLFPDLQALRQGDRWNASGAPDRAIESFTTASEYGNREAMRKLGIHHRDGKGIEADAVMAHAWFTLAADYGDSSSANNANELEASMSEEQLASAQESYEDLVDDYGMEEAHSKRKKWARREIRGSSSGRPNRREQTQIQIDGMFFRIQLGDMMDALDAYADELKG